MAPQAEWLEPRLLYSADLGSGWVPGPVMTETGELRTLSAGGEYVTADAQPQTLAQAYATAALNFERNEGQDAAGVDFTARGSGYRISLDGGHAEIALDGAQSAVRLDLVGAQAGVQAQGEGLLQGRSNYLIGNDPSQWHTNIANYGGVRYEDVYQGIDIRYYGTQRQLEYDFIVGVGADASQVRLRFDGAQATLDAEGNLQLLTAEGRELRFAAPVSYQMGPNGREAVTSAYRLFDDGTVGFELGAYDASRELVIDPVLDYASYFGGNAADTALGVAVDASGFVYITGRTASNIGTALGGTGGGDIYVAKFSADLSTLIYSTRIGGTGDEQGNAIAVDAAGNAVVTGWTASGDFPMVAANDNAMNGSQDAVVFKLDATGAALVFSTYFGGANNTDSGNAVAVDGAGNIYAAGRVSYDGGTVNPQFGTTDNAFLNKYAGSGAAVYQTQFGGTSGDAATGVAVDAGGSAYLVGNTNSNNLPVVGAHEGTYRDEDAFLARFASDGSTLLYSTYIGDDKEDSASAVAIDGTGKAYVVGQTRVNGATNFEVTTGALKTTAANGTTGYLRIYDTTQTGAASLVYSTYLGGADGDRPTGVAVIGGRVVVTGTTSSASFPITTDAVQNWSGTNSMFLLVIEPAGAGAADALYGTFYGQGMEVGGVATNGTHVYVAGSTLTGGLATGGGASTVPAGDRDAIVIAFRPPNTAPLLSGANDLPALLEDSASNAGMLVSDLVAGRTSDADGGALIGIAVTAVDASQGAWQYSLDGGANWVAITVPSAASALLLAADAQTRIRFVPVGNFNGTVSGGLSFRAWDRTSGSAGSTANTTVNGGVTAFSTAVASASVTVTAVNDAPVQTAGTLNNLTVAEGSVTSLGLAGLAYGPGGGTDEASQSFTYTVTAVPAAAFGQIVLADGTTVVVAGNSYTLAQLQGMQFRAGAGVNSGTATFSFSVIDSGGTANGGANTLAQSLTIGIVNQAPVLTGANALPTVLEDAAAGNGMLVSDLLTGQVSDAGGVYGIAVVAATSANGSWEYSRDGGASWSAFTGVSGSSATLLAADGRIRFVPNANWNGTATGLSFRAWDRSGGTATATTGDTAVNGGSSPYSVATATASITVTAVNDQPVRTAGALADLTVPDGAGATSLGLAGLAYGAGGGADEASQSFTYTVTAVPAAAFGQIVLADGTTVVVAGNSYTLAQLQGMQFIPAVSASGGPASFAFSVTDSGGTANGGVASLTQSLLIQVVPNSAPVLAGANALPDLLEDTFTSAGISVADLVAGQVSDANSGSPAGIAVTAASSPGGAWQFSVDNGASWSAFASVSDASARLLAADSRIRFVPNANWNGTATGLSFRAWDQSGGTAGATTGDTTVNGGSSPYSAATATASIAVTAVNDQPVQTAGALNNLTVPEGSVTSLGLAGLAYGPGGGADEAAQSFSYTVTAVPAAAFGQIVLADGTTVVVAGNSYTLAELQGMQFRAGAGVNSGTAIFSFSVIDSGGVANGGANTLAQSLTIGIVNQAPVLSGANALPTVLEDAAAGNGMLVSDLLVGQVSDAGGVYGIAVVAATSADGSWEYSRDGGASWSAFTGVSGSSATLLAADSRIRFVPNADWNGTATGLGFRAWDRSGGTASATTGDTTVNGGNSAYSAASATASISVTPVNDAPVRLGLAPPALNVDRLDRSAALGLAGLGYVTGGDRDEGLQSLTVTITAVPSAAVGTVLLADGVTPVLAGNTYTLAELQGMLFLPAAGSGGLAGDLAWTLQDDGGTANGGVDRISDTLRINIAAAPEPLPIAPTPAPPAPAPAPPPVVDLTPAPAPSPVAAAPVAVAPAADPAPAPAPAPAAATAPANTRGSREAAAVGDALMDSPASAEILSSGASPRFAVERAAIPLESVRTTVAGLADRGGMQLVGFVPTADFLVTGFSGADNAGGRVTIAEFQQSLRGGAFLEEMNRAREQLRQDFDLDRTLSISVAGLSLGVSVVYVLWLVRGGVLVGSYLSALPAWRFLDPLPVLARAGADDEDDDDEALDARADERQPDPLRGFA